MLNPTEFINLVARMREAQKAFFDTRRLPSTGKRLLWESNQLEAEVDAAVKEMQAALRPPLPDPPRVKGLFPAIHRGLEKTHLYYVSNWGHTLLLSRDGTWKPLSGQGFEEHDCFRSAEEALEFCRRLADIERRHGLRQEPNRQHRLDRPVEDECQQGRSGK